MATKGSVEWFMDHYEIDRETAEKAHKAAQKYIIDIQHAPEGVTVTEPKILRKLAVKKDKEAQP